MEDVKREWARKKNGLVTAMVSLGFPEELGVAIAKELGSPKAMDRMLGYLVKVKPKSAELINAWREKKAAETANDSYNNMLNRVLV